MDFDYGGFTGDVIGMIVSLLNLYWIIIFIRVVFSWINPNPYNPVGGRIMGTLMAVVYGITDPVLDALRPKLPRFLWSSGLDFTPLILIVLINLIISFLQSIRIG